MSEISPVIVTIVEGLGLNFWSQETLPIPILIINNSEAEEAQASISLFAAGKTQIHTLSLKAHLSRGKALYLALIEVKKLGFTHAITLSYPFEQSDALHLLIQTAKKNPEAVILATKTDRRRVLPLSQIKLDDFKNDSNIEETIIGTNLTHLIKVTLPGKPETETFSDKVGALLRTIIVKLQRK